MRSLAMVKRSLVIAALAGLAACQPDSEQGSNNILDTDVNAAEAANAEVEVLPPDDSAEPATPASGAGPASNEAEDDSEDSPPTALIPAQYRGRWGINAKDCEPGRSDAKGLMTVGDTSIRFYESVAALQEQRPAIATSFSGVFAYTGEGQTWERVITLTRTGDTLKRAQADGNFTYTRCT
ncbi:MAG TPA: hypothetical protein VFO42_02130 [Sphingomicrobium sp.]|nr:hypothetical protein [Sphingomicrobium sp.]